jgi:hypothetical protein
VIISFSTRSEKRRRMERLSLRMLAAGTRKKFYFQVMV